MNTEELSFLVWSTFIMIAWIVWSVLISNTFALFAGLLVLVGLLLLGAKLIKEETR